MVSAFLFFYTACQNWLKTQLVAFWNVSITKSITSGTNRMWLITKGYRRGTYQTHLQLPLQFLQHLNYQDPCHRWNDCWLWPAESKIYKSFKSWQVFPSFFCTFIHKRVLIDNMKFEESLIDVKTGNMLMTAIISEFSKMKWTSIHFCPMGILHFKQP